MVSGAGKPLAPALALLGRWSVWPVLLPPLGGQPPLLAVYRVWAVNPNLSPLGGCQVGLEEGGAGRECQASLSYREARRTPATVSLADFKCSRQFLT